MPEQPDEGPGGRPRRTPEQRRAVVAVGFVLACLLGLAVWPQLAGSPPQPHTSVAATTSGRSGAAPTPSPGSTGSAHPAQHLQAGGWMLLGDADDPMARVRWPQVSYPLSCAGVGVQVVSVGLGDVDRDGHSDAVVTVHCRAGAGSPPDGLYVFRGPASHPGLVATLLVPGDDVLLSSVAVAGSTVTAAGSTYSSGQVPRCCPDRHFSGSWRWDGSGFVREG